MRTHPETGEKILFVNAFTTHFTNYHTPERVRFGQDANPGASLLLNYLISQAYVPEYHVHFRFRRNSVAIWDNRCTQHYAAQDFWPAVAQSEARRHHRRQARRMKRAHREASRMLGPMFREVTHLATYERPKTRR